MQTMCLMQSAEAPGGIRWPPFGGKGPAVDGASGPLQSTHVMIYGIEHSKNTHLQASMGMCTLG